MLTRMYGLQAPIALLIMTADMDNYTTTKKSRRLKDKSSQHPSRTKFPEEPATEHDIPTIRAPRTPCIQCWQSCAWVGVANFSPFAQPPFTTCPARQHWTSGVRGMHKDHLLYPLHKYARCELLSVNSPCHSGPAMDACMRTTHITHTLFAEWHPEFLSIPATL